MVTGSSRRTVIKTIGAGSLVGLAGCVGDDDNDGADDNDDDAADATTNGVPNGEPETINLEVGSFTTEDSFLVGPYSWGVWIDKVQDKLENYKIEYEFHGAGAIGSGGELYDLAADGVIDIAIDQPTWQGGRMSMIDFISLPLFPPTVEGHRSACQALHEMGTPGGETDVIYDEFTNLGVHPLLCYTATTYQIGTQEPIHDIDDLEGLVVRTGAGTKGMIGETLGMSPTELTAEDILTALETGVVDVEMTPISAPWQFGWYEVLNYWTTNLNLGGFPQAMVIGEDTLEEFPQEVTDAMIEAGEETVTEYAQNYRSAKEEQIFGSDIVTDEEPFDENSQFMIYESDAADEVNAAADEVVDDWVEEFEDQEAAEEVISTFESLRQDYL